MRARDRSRLAVLGLLLGLLAVFGCRAPDEPVGGGLEAQGSNLVLISVDTLRADHLGVYGYHRPTSPNLGELAADGVLFENFIHSGGGTLPSHLSMLTSLTPVTHGVHPGNPTRLDDERVTLAEELKAAGYSTAAFTDGGWMSRKFGFDQGFDLYDDSVVHGHFAVTMPKARQWISDHRDGPFFLFLHTYDVHSQRDRLPYDCPGTFPELYTDGYDGDFDGCREGKCASKLLAGINAEIAAGQLDPLEVFEPADIDFIEALYDGCINYVDEQIGELIDYLEELGIYDDTVFVVTSDHGEEFLDHGMFLHDQGGYEEFVRLPLILRLPNAEFGGTRTPHLAAMIDVMPTLLEILDLPTGDQAQGLSLLPSIAESRAVRRAVHIYSILRTDRWKFFSLSSELYDLEADEDESINVFSQETELVERLDAHLATLLKQDRRAIEVFAGTAEEGLEVELTEEERKNLEALGYLD